MRLVNKPINVELEGAGRYRPHTLHTHLGPIHVRSRLDFWVVVVENRGLNGIENLELRI